MREVLVRVRHGRRLGTVAAAVDGRAGWFCTLAARHRGRGRMVAAAGGRGAADRGRLRRISGDVNGRRRYSLTPPSHPRPPARTPELSRTLRLRLSQSWAAVVAMLVPNVSLCFLVRAEARNLGRVVPDFWMPDGAGRDGHDHDQP